MAAQRSERFWWDGREGERFWLESTDRDDIGADLKAPLLDDAQRPNWRYGLFRHAAPGDIVFHYDKKRGAITSLSRIAGTASEAPIVWAARGSYARERGAVPVEVPGYRIPLADHRRLDAPLTLEALRADRVRLGALYEAIAPGGARYFPFELSDRPVRPLQGYAFKLPASFVSAFAGLRAAVDAMVLDGRSDIEVFRDAVGRVEAAASGHAIGGLQALRARHKGLRRVSRSLFGRQGIDQGWLFHYGGREELQFNLGLDLFPDGRTAFRAGVAFSFEPSRSLPDIDILIPKVARFNAWLRDHPERFADLAMWHYRKGERSVDYRPRPIDESLIRPDCFVFLGARQPLDRVDPAASLDMLDRLLPLYRWVEGIAEGLEALEAVSGAAAGLSGALELGKGRAIDGGRWIRATSRERSLDIYLRHRELQRRLADALMAEGASAVGLEVTVGPCLIDAVAHFGETLRFYEVKTASSARACLREAIGQLLEYALWPGAQRPAELVVVGEPALDAEAEAYLAALNARFPLPLAYRQLVLDA